MCGGVVVVLLVLVLVFILLYIACLSCSGSYGVVSNVPQSGNSIVNTVNGA